VTLPKPNGDFEWVQENWGPGLRCAAVSAAAVHSFSTRYLALGGVSDDDSWSPLAEALGVEKDALVRMRQIHCADVFEASRPSLPTNQPDEWPTADIAIGRDSSIALTVRTADCVPVLMADRRTGAVAAVHAGWRGTAAGAVMVAVQALSWRFGTEARDVIAAVGPSIGPCCYTVGEELIPHFRTHPDAPGWFDRAGGLRLDLWQATHDQLRRAGVSPENIHSCKLCTSDHPDLFHSYRRDGYAAGRLVAAIRANPRD
jgi:YfiH family protein